MTEKQRKAISAGHLKVEDGEIISGFFHENGKPMFAKDGTMLDENGNRSIFDDVDD